MDVLYALGKGSHWMDNELRYSLRSISKYLKGFDRVWIIGDVPRFPIKGINYIAFKENSLYPAVNIMNKIMIACHHEDISEKFLFINDDHFLLKEYHISEFPFYYCGDLKNVVNKTDYAKTVQNTINALSAFGLTTKNFDIHTPIIYQKSHFIEIMDMYDWNLTHGLCIKSLYCNTLHITGTYAEDGKLNQSKGEEQLRHWLDKHDILSVGDECLNHMLKNRFPIMFPNKSKFESV